MMSSAWALIGLSFVAGCASASGEAVEVDSDLSTLKSDAAADAIVRKGKVVQTDATTPNEAYSAFETVDGYIPGATLDQVYALLGDTRRWTEVTGYTGEKLFKSVALQPVGGAQAGEVEVIEPFALTIPVTLTMRKGAGWAESELTNDGPVRKFFVTVVNDGNFFVRTKLRSYRGGVLVHAETGIKVNLQEHRAAADTGEFVFDWLKRTLAKP